ncbi:hypothetical protein PMY56_00185 [Clostridium tertium]|jgi:hypothetical protein|uniref:Uncharacterized protein n=1 Tax=Clostridium tertium TaxID=1559 RepID=A0A9X3XN74_9CLOT|nr:MULTISPECIES: hypothetical protein [Clostridium]EEH98968.1 hypothetical protein CSBG_02594 [Clostridium sp. 7_2_43FAA]MBP1867901.1 hypothetical protein [Clostridium tertium]MBS5307907.1 hypothetical protein [Clostridium sp.]MBU6136043.1 hypothetical protein [Clostridium tertium]MDB1921307.1 hypothetical protein [Clostridium tertium]
MVASIDINKHCSLNKSIRNLFYKKQNINNSIFYTEEEKKELTREIEKDIYDTWKKIRYSFDNNGK